MSLQQIILFAAANAQSSSTWTQATLPVNATWACVAYGNSVFIAVAGGPSNIAATSTDGITWTQRTLPSSQVWQLVAFGAGVFVAVVRGSNVAATSPDGITWTQRTLPAWASPTRCSAHRTVRHRPRPLHDLA
jgi:hypothetical protein